MRVSNALLLLLSVVNLVLAQVDSGVSGEDVSSLNDERKIYAGITQFKRSLPRYTIMGQPGPSRLEMSIEYLYFLATFLVPGLVLAIFCLFGCIVFFFCRFCFNKCGGRRYTGELGYTKKNVFMTKIWLYGAAAAMAAACYLGMSGNNKFTTSVGHMFDYVVTIINDVRALVESIQSTLDGIFTTLGQPMDNSPYTSIYDMLNSSISAIDDGESYVNEYEAYRNYGMWAYFSLFLAVAAAFAFFAFCKWGCLSITLALLLFLVSTVTWLLFAIHLPLSMAGADVCHELDIILTTEEDSPLRVLIQCLDNSSLSMIYQQFDDSLSLTYQTLTQAANGTYLLDNSFPWDNADLPITASNFDAYVAAIDTEPRWSSSDTNAQDLYNGQLALITVPTSIDALRGILDVLAECTFVISAITKFQIVFCNELLVSIDFLMAGIGVVGVSSFLLVICGIRSKKRFNKKYSQAYIVEMFMAMEEEKEEEEREMQKYEQREAKHDRQREREPTLHQPGASPYSSAYGNTPPPVYKS